MDVTIVKRLGDAGNRMGASRTEREEEFVRLKVSEPGTDDGESALCPFHLLACVIRGTLEDVLVLMCAGLTTRLSQTLEMFLGFPPILFNAIRVCVRQVCRSCPTTHKPSQSLIGLKFG